MAIDEQRTRRSLHAKLADTLGDDEAALLMDYLPPVGWADVATKRDLDVLGTATKHDIDTLGAATKHDIDALRTELRAEIQVVHTELHSMRSDLHAEISDLKSTLLMWLVPTVIGSIVVSVTLSRVL